MKSTHTLQLARSFLARVFACMILVTAALALDVNKDGMDDLWQARYNIAAFAGSEDPDGDGRINFAEAMNMTDPLNTQNPGLGMIFITDLNPADGLDDRWQTRFSLTAADKLLDPDGDGRSNLEENYVGSDPFVGDDPWSNAGSTQGGGAAAGPQEFILTMPWTVPGWRYTLQCSDTLMQNEWSTAAVAVGQNVSQWGTGGSISVTATTGGAERKFYRWLIDSPDTDGDFLGDWVELQLGSDINDWDSDGDGVPDHAEYRDGSDLLDSASRPGFNTEPEHIGTVPAAELAYQFKYVNNGWHRDTQPEQEPYEYGGLEWESTGVPNQGEIYDVYSARWQSKLQELSWTTQTTGNEWDRWLPADEFAFGHGKVEASAWWWYDVTNAPVNLSHFVTVSHKRAVLRTQSGQNTGHSFSKRFLAVVSNGPAVGFVPRRYDVVRFETLTVPVGQNLSASGSTPPVTMEPVPVQDKRITDTLASISVTPTNLRALDDSSYIFSIPDPWITIPNGVPQTLTINNWGSNADVVYRLVGAGLDDTPTSSYSITVNGQAQGDARLEVGYRNSDDGSILYAPEPLVKLAMRNEIAITVKIHPIAYNNGSGTVILPQHLPSQATVSEYLNRVFDDQANIRCNVVIEPVSTAAWDDVGVGVSADEPENAGVGDQMLTLLAGRTSIHPNMETGEQFMITHHSPPDPSNGTINVYWVVAPQGLFDLRWETDTGEENYDWESLVYTRLFGYAYQYRRNGAYQCWVWDHPRDAVQGPYSALQTCAHEVGHMLGLNHSEFAPLGSPAFEDSEQRLMSGRYGLKRASGQWRLNQVERNDARAGAVRINNP